MKKALWERKGIRVLSVFLCIILALSMMVGMLIADIRLATTKENASEIVRQGLFAAYATRLPGHGGNGGGYSASRPVQVKLDETTDSGDDTEGAIGVLVDWFMSSVLAKNATTVSATREEIISFVMDSGLDEQITELAGSLVSDMVTGDSTTKLDVDTICAILEDNADLMKEYFNVTVDDTLLTKVRTVVEENDYIQQIQDEGIVSIIAQASPSLSGSISSAANDIFSAIPGVDIEIDEDTNIIMVLLESFQKFASLGAMLICFGIAAVCVALLIWFNWGRIYRALRMISIPLLVVSLPGSVPTVWALIGGKLWTSSVIGKVAAAILKIVAPVYLGVLGAGIVLLVLSIVFRKKKKKAPAEAGEAPVEEAPVEEAPAEEAPVEETPIEEASAEEE